MTMVFKIILFAVCIIAATVFVVDLGIFEEDYITVPEGGDYSSYTIENLNESIGMDMDESMKPGGLGEWGLITLIWKSIVFFYHMVVSIPGLIAIVVRMFGVPILLVVFIGAPLSVVIVYEVIQFVSGRYGKNIE